MSWEERFRSKRLVPASDVFLPEAEEPDHRALYRQSLNVREYREANIRFFGDPKRASGYIPIARMLLGGLVHQLALGGIDFGHRIVSLPDGTKIRVIHNSGINLIEITSDTSLIEEYRDLTFYVYMESGLIDALIPMQWSLPYKRWPERELTGKLYRDGGDVPLTREVMDALKKEDKLRKVTYLFEHQPENYPDSGGKSYALWYTEKEERPPNLTDEEYEEFLNSAGLPFQDKKASGMLAKPSQVTGKLRLYQQAILGLQYKDENRRPQLAGLSAPWTFQYKGVSFSYTANNTMGLATTDEGTYWLVNIVYTSNYQDGDDYYLVKVRELPINLFGKQLLKYVKENEIVGEERLMAEAYVLAYAEPENGSPWYIIHKFKADDFKGKPLAYGWKFSWNGQEAAMVTYEVEYTAFNKVGEPTDYERHTRLGIINLTFNPEFDPDDDKSKPATATFTLSEECKNIEIRQPGADNVWIPEYLLNIQELAMLPPLGLPARPVPKLSDFPVYCFYANDPFAEQDELRVVRYRYDYEEKPAPTTAIESFKRGDLCSLVNIKDDVNQYYGTVYKIGFSICDRGGSDLYNGEEEGAYKKLELKFSYTEGEQIFRLPAIGYNNSYTHYTISSLGCQEAYKYTPDSYPAKYYQIRYKPMGNLSIDSILGVGLNTSSLGYPVIGAGSSPPVTLFVIPFYCGNSAYIGNSLYVAGTHNIADYGGVSGRRYGFHYRTDAVFTDGPTLVEFRTSALADWKVERVQVQKYDIKVKVGYGKYIEPVAEFKIASETNRQPKRSAIIGAWDDFFYPEWLTGAINPYRMIVNSSVTDACYYVGDLRRLLNGPIGDGKAVVTVGEYPDANEELSNFALTYFIGHA